MKSVIPTVLDGFNATVFAYGSTGAGKTHTMMGSERDDASRLLDDTSQEGNGMIPQALSDIFRQIAQRQVADELVHQREGTIFQWTVMVSYLEVYNEQIQDLLEPKAKPLSLREDPKQGVVHVTGLHAAEAKSTAEVMELLRRGNRNRKTEPTAANQVSSRSHAVLQVVIRHTATRLLSQEMKHEGGVKKNVHQSEGKLSLIDLAGSERASATQNTGLRMTEGANINKSLLSLANCINALAAATTKSPRSNAAGGAKRKKIMRRQSDVFCYSSTRVQQPAPQRRSITRPKVQYRDSKLTHLLKTSLEGDGRLIMIANINPSDRSFEESHNTLKYANRAKNIKVRPTMHVVTADLTHQERAEKLELENIALRVQLVEHLRGGEESTPRKRRKKSVHSTPQMMSQLCIGQESAKDNTMDLQMENAAMQRKIAALEIQVQQLRKKLGEKDQTSTSMIMPTLRRSARRMSCGPNSSVSSLPSLMETKEWGGEKELPCHSTSDINLPTSTTKSKRLRTPSRVSYHKRGLSASETKPQPTRKTPSRKAKSKTLETRLVFSPRPEKSHSRAGLANITNFVDTNME